MTTSVIRWGLAGLIVTGSLGLEGASRLAAQGLVGITVCCPNHFVQADPGTGGLTTLSLVGDATFGFSLSAAVDPATHSFYVVRSSPDYHIATINTLTGALVESPALAKGIFALGFDSASSKLVGITVCCPNHFVQADPGTGGLTILSLVGDATFGFSLSAAVDPATHSFYIVRSSPDYHIATINTLTGALVESPTLAKGIFALGFDASGAPTVAVPTLSGPALAALALAIAGLALFVIRRS